MSKTSRTLLLAFAALGLGASSTSSYVHYKLLTEQNYASFCDVNATVNCTQAYLSAYGSFWGVPVALFGVLFFALVLLLVAIGGRDTAPARDAIPAYVFAMSTAGLAFILYLAWASYTQLHTFCLLCAITYVSVIAIFIISGGATTFPMTTLPRRVPRDARALFSSPAAIVIVLLFLFGAGTLIAYFPSEPPRQAAPVALKTLPEEERTKLAQWYDLQPVAQPAIPNDGAKVLVAIFSDYQCPHCKAAHEAYKPLIAKYAHDPRVKFVLKHFPLESECNPNSGNVHSASCEAAAAVVMARATGKAAQMDAWLFDNQDSLTPSSVRDAGKSIGGIADFNGGYAEALKQVKADAVLGGQLGVGQTPTVFLNGKKLGAGVVDPSALDALIDTVLNRAK
jgi:protein-disulfide isomerase/uncharacterized membrane protein